MRHKNIVLSIALAALAFSCSQEKKLPFLGPKTVNAKGDTVYHQIPAFQFLNQDSVLVTEKDVAGKVYVADFFFTTCPSICPKMTNNMAWLQNKIKNNPKVKLVSFSVTPDIDSVPVLKSYAQKKGVIDSKWNLLTGDKKEIYYLARKSFLVVKTGKPSELYDMVHTENFVLVDEQKRIRGFYDGTNLDGPTEPGIKNVQQLWEDIQFLSQEN